jgi:DNA-binding NtrC family response regulator
MRVRVVAPKAVEFVDLGSAGPKGVLIGRAPTAEWLRGKPPALDVETIQGLRIASDNISANHAVMWREGDTTQLMDLGSRNGTWLRLSPFEPIGLSSFNDAEVRLALPNDAESSEGPADARWSGSEGFDEAVQAAIVAWLERRGIVARVFPSRDRGDNHDSHTPSQLPLSDEVLLNVVPAATVGGDWTDTLAVLWRYVDEQRRLFAAEEATRNEGLILASDGIRRAHRQVVDAAGRALRVLLVGATGTGKEGLARAYHRHSGRTGPFVALNCSELNKDLVRAELFGAEEGAFTGSVRRIVGAVEQANGGTLFLDEIGELPLDVQPMLLRFLDRGEYVRLGSYGKPRHTDARIICATNRDLREEIKRDRFRQDLWFRLSIQVVEIPALRERFEDIQQFLQSQAFGAGSLLAALSPPALEVLRAHPWEGNFRELANFAARIAPTGSNIGIDAAQCRKALAAGSLTIAPPPRASALPTGGGIQTWPEVSAQAGSLAAQAFHEDHGTDPGSWNDIKDYIENYLKPVLFARLSGAAHGDVVEARHALKLGADRGTASRQLERYFDRFTR